MGTDAAKAENPVVKYGPPGAAGLGAVAFVAQNTETATFTFLWFEFSWPLWLVLAIFLAVGLGIGWFLGRRATRRKLRSNG